MEKRNMESDFNFNQDNKNENTPHKIKIKPLKDRLINYDNAVKFANDIDITENSRYFSFINGNFIFGDFIEALIVEKNYKIDNLTISTLSLSEENIYNIKILMVKKLLKQLTLIVSDYFYSHERTKLIKLIVKEFGDSVTLIEARSHTKTCIFETDCGKKIVMHGSANLRSSGNIEQIQIEENKELFDYIETFNSKLLTVYKSKQYKSVSQGDWDLLKI